MRLCKGTQEGATPRPPIGRKLPLGRIVANLDRTDFSGNSFRMGGDSGKKIRPGS